MGNRLKNLKIRYKLLINYVILYIFCITAGSITLDAFVRSTIEKNIESELKNSTISLYNLVKTSVSVSIKNHLRAVAEKNKEIAGYYYSQYRQGFLNEAEARQQAAAVMLSQTIGKSGYIYCLDSRGIVTVHPEPEVLGSDVSGFDFVRQQMQRKEGYVEYQWKNPGERETRPKSLYMAYFEPWDWIISASSYRREFADLIEVDDLRQSILSLKFGRTGYSYITDGSGNTVVHPKMEGINIFTHEDIPSNFFKGMLEEKSGKMVYSWRNPDELTFRDKLVIFNYLPEYDWIVASSSYTDEFYAPLRTVRTIIVVSALATILLAIPVTLRISASITTPLRQLTDSLREAGASRDFTARIPQASSNEIGILAAYFNRFMERLETYSNSLKQEIVERREVEEALRASEERYREAQEVGDRVRRKIGQDLHDDLCPHLIGIEGFCNVISKNLEKTSRSEAAKIEKIRRLISQATDKARNLSRGLCPSHLMARGLETALEDLCRNVREFSHLHCSLDVQARMDLPEDRAAQLFYIIQEAVYNAVKHASPDAIIITLTKADKKRLIVIDDDGIGMPKTPASPGIGMRVMAHRAGQIGCGIDWERPSGGGTRVLIWVDDVLEEDVDPRESIV